MKENMKKPAPKIDLERGDKKPNWRSTFWPFFIMLVMLWAWQTMVGQLTVRTIPYSEFRAHLARHEVVNAVVRQSEISGRIVPRTAPATGAGAPIETNLQSRGMNASVAETGPFQCRTLRMEDPDLVRDLQASGAQYTGERPSLLSQVLLSWVLPLAIYLGEVVG